MKHRKAVTYYRVSTAKQGKSGLGLEAQRNAVEQHLAAGDWQLVGEFVEIESGKLNQRPQLEAALAQCELTGATLIVAKLDRLSRNVAFLAALQDSGTKFVAADMPEANELTIHIMAAVAQAERKAISLRTKEALAAAKREVSRWEVGETTSWTSVRDLPRALRSAQEWRRSVLIRWGVRSTHFERRAILPYASLHPHLRRRASLHLAAAAGPLHK